MNRITWLALNFVLVLFAPTLATAQMDALKNSTPQERATLQTEWMQANLSLDDKASASVAEINLKYAQETQALMDSASSKFEKIMSFRRNMEAKDVELKAVFTPEQYSLYEQKKDELKEIVKRKFIEKGQASQ